MELKEIEHHLQKLIRVGTASCESCGAQTRFSEIEMYNGIYLCPECLKKIAWKPEEILELPA
jgi:formylmethanofuran dehydrogenase subunit E